MECAFRIFFRKCISLTHSIMQKKNVYPSRHNYNIQYTASTRLRRLDYVYNYYMYTAVSFAGLKFWYHVVMVMEGI